MNLVSRPSGGLISDKFGSRKWTLVVIMAALGMGHLLTQSITSSWALPWAIAAMMLATSFAQAGAGATFGIVPLMRKEITGQIAGNVGAYGNFGGVIYLTIYSLTNAQTLFATMAIAALICASLCAFFLTEPKGSFADHHSDEAPAVVPSYPETYPETNALDSSQQTATFADDVKL